MSMKSFEEKLKKIFCALKEDFDSVKTNLDEPVPEINEPSDAEPVDDVAATVEPTEPSAVPFEKAPKFRIYWRAWKDGNNTSGQTESVLDTAQMARAESMTKLYDLGFNDIEILAIETIKNNESETIQI